MGLYNKKFDNKRKVQVETGSETGSQAPSPCLGAARGDAVGWCGAFGHRFLPFFDLQFPKFYKNNKYNFIRTECKLFLTETSTYTESDSVVP